jgi:predicted RNA-binding Zn ribbon-like protein
LTGEPLAVDLLNSRWRRADGEVDLLDSTDGLAQWLSEAGESDVPPSDAVRRALVHVRSVLHGVVRGAPGADDDLNAVLARGLTVRSLHDGEPQERWRVVSSRWAWP